MASTSEIVKPVMKSPRATGMHFIPCDDSILSTPLIGNPPQTPQDSPEFSAIIDAMGGLDAKMGSYQTSRVHNCIFFHVTSSAFANRLMVDFSSPDFRQEPIIRLTEPGCPMASRLAIQELPAFVLPRSNAATTTIRSSLFGSLAMAFAVDGTPNVNARGLVPFPRRPKQAGEPERFELA